MESRALLAVIISLIILIFYQMYFVPRPEREREKAAPEKAQTTPQAREEGAKPIAPEEKIPAVAPAPKAPVTAEIQPQPGHDVVIDTPLYTAVFNTRGARLKDFRVKKYLDKIGQGAQPIDLAETLGNPYPFWLEITQANFPFSADTLFQVSANSLKLGPRKDQGEILFTWNSPEGLRVTQQMIFYGDNYGIDILVKMSNLSTRSFEGRPGLVWDGKIHPHTGGSGGFACIPGAGGSSRVSVPPLTALIKKEFHEVEPKDLKEPKRFMDPVQWGGFQDQYFLAAFIPHKSEGTELTLRKNSDTSVEMSIAGPKASLPPGTQFSESFYLFLGPKDLEKLKAFGHDLDRALDFGWFDIVAKPMLYAMQFFHRFTGNYGLAIILLTVVIKIIFWWPTNLSYRSMREMKKLQPEMTKLREKLRDNKEKLNKEMMELYRRYKVNPMGGCLPMAIQIPVFFALYKVLLYSIQLRHAPFYWWIQDLSAPDPYYISPILMGGSMFAQQWLTPTTGDPTQAKMMLIMPVVFTFMFLSFPTGLVIYWLFSNLLSIGQQLYINRQKK